jgi:pyruvate dehydrogenase E1 component alpha subunit
MSKAAKLTFGKETYRNWYELMLLIRRFEEKCAQMYSQQKIRGFLHLYNGQEAIMAGTMSAIGPNDPIITAYRDHGHALAVGISPNAVMAELYGKATGCTKGKGGSMHMFSKEHRFYGGHGIVGAQIPLGAGMALAEQYKGTGNVSLTYMGDGAVRQGALHEAFNMAMLWKLPAIFIVENNEYAMGTSVLRTTNMPDIYKMGAAYDMPSFQVDGMNCETVHEAIAAAVERARKGDGPTFLEIKTYRYRGHSMSDPASYRTKEELANYKEKDPLETTKKTMISKKFADQAYFDELEERIEKIVEESVEFAENSPLPDPTELFTDVYKGDYPFIMD